VVRVGIDRQTAPNDTKRHPNGSIDTVRKVVRTVSDTSRGRSATRTRGGAVAAALVALPLLLAAGTARASAPTVRAALAASRTLDDLVLAAAGVALVAVLVWLAAAVAAAALDVLSASSAPRGRAGRRARRPLADSLSPALVRRLVAVALGAALGSGAVAAGAAPRVPDAGWAAVAPAVAGSHVAAPVAPPVVAPSTAPAAAPDPAWRAVTPVHAAGPALRPTATGGAERVVHRGDSLWSIAAARLGPDARPGAVLREVHRLHALNADVVGADPDVLLPGQVLRVS